MTKEGLEIVAQYNKDLHQELLDRQAVVMELAKQLSYHRKIIEEKEKLREVRTGNEVKMSTRLN